MRIFDEGYSKTLFINTYLPKDKLEKRYFYMNTEGGEAWTLLLTKALAKYYGSYDKLSQASFEDLCKILMGSQPSQLGSRAFKKIYKHEIATGYDSDDEVVFDDEFHKNADAYADIARGLKAGRFILVVKRKDEDQEKLPDYIHKKFMSTIEKAFYPGFYYRIT